MYVKGVKRSSKHTVRAHGIFTYNFLNIPPIFNLKKVLRSWDFGLSNHTKCYVCQSMSEVSKVKITSNMPTKDFVLTLADLYTIFKLIAIVLMFRDKLPAAYCFNE